VGTDFFQPPRSDAGERIDDRAGPVVATLPRPRLSKPVTLAVVADAHLAVAETGTWKVLHRTESRLETALALAAGGVDGTEADAVVFVGDQTHDGLAAEFDRFADLVAALDRTWTAIPGNHDVRKDFDDHDGLAKGAVDSRFRGDATPAERVARTDTASPYPSVLDVGGLRVICLNTAAPADRDQGATWGGAVGPAQRARLQALLAAAPERPTVVVAHHNLGPLPEHEAAAPWDRFPMDDAAAVRDILAAANVPLAVTGHHHVPAARTHGDVTELLAPAVCSFPQAMLALHVGPDGTAVQLLPLADDSGVSEAYWHAATGKTLGQGILDMTTSRLEEL